MIFFPGIQIQSVGFSEFILARSVAAALLLGLGGGHACAGPLASNRSPEDLVRKVGEQAVFRVVAQGEGALAYAWYLNGIKIVNPGANSDTFTIDSVAAIQDGGTIRFGIYLQPTKLFNGMGNLLLPKQPSPAPSAPAGTVP